MSQLTPEERQVMEERVRAHNLPLLETITASLEPLKATLDEIETAAQNLIIMDGGDVLRIRDTLTGNIASIKAALEYHINDVLPRAVTSHAPQVVEATV